MNRREFIKSIGAAGVAACVPAELPASQPAKTQQVKMLICEAGVPQPSGSIYSRQVLEVMAREHDGHVVKNYRLYGIMEVPAVKKIA